MEANPRPTMGTYFNKFLDLENPRHEPYQTQAEVIEYLCKEEYVYELARDIAKVGLNPLELFAVIPLHSDGRSSGRSYIVAEGNRRMCALKLLHDPELAPANRRKDFAKLAESVPEFDEILGVEFRDKKEAGPWLERIHGGLQGGIGRKTWNAEQKTRYMGDAKNVVAQTVLDYAEQKGFITAKSRKGKLTTAQRYLSNRLVREALGLDTKNLEDIARNRPPEDFDLLVRRFVSDLMDGTANSRAKGEQIEEYSRELGTVPGLSGKRNAPESISAPGGKGKGTRRSARRPRRPKHLPYEGEIYSRLKSIPSYKLERIYYSICEIRLEDHTPLISVGAWSFFECLTALCGRNSNTSFPDFLSKTKLNALGFKENTSSISQALQRISGYGNTTKHHQKAANFNGEQLANDFDVLKDVILKLADEARVKNP